MIRYSVLILLATASAFADTWRVPEDVGTIQGALDQISNGDTILVAPGLYSESLQAPNNLSFVMIGRGDPVKPDSLWPIIDPSALNYSNRLACLTLPYQTSAEISYIVFRNGALMYPRQGGTPTGGIYNNGLGLTLRSCRFDSTYNTLYPNLGPLNVWDCRFIENVACCIQAPLGSDKTIANSSFSGMGQLLWLNGPALVEGCMFDETVAGDWVWLSGSGVAIRNCSFGPTTVPSYSILWSGGMSGSVIEDNYFHDLDVTGAVLSLAGMPDDTIMVRNNIFDHTRGVQASGAGGGIFLNQYQGPANFRVSGNRFMDCRGVSQEGFRAVKLLATQTSMSGNIFSGSDDNIPCVVVSNINNISQIEGENFAGTGWALRNQGATLNAENNWWGDSTGPYHAELNPEGLGARITGPVDFDPWRMHPDTSLRVPGNRTALPLDSRVDIYPNPFNATATIQLVVNQPGEYEVELFNPLGQRVQQLWSGYVSDRKAITFNGQSLGSGIYFARALKSSDHRTVALNKLLMLK